MKTDREPSADIGGDRVENSFPVLLKCLVALLALESIALVALVIWLVLQEGQATASDSTSGIAIIVIAVLCALWIVLTTVAAARRRSWMRASAITVHVMIAAVALGCFTGVTAVPQAGWVLIAVAVLGIGLVVAPSVTKATARDTMPAADAPDSAQGPGTKKP